MALMCKKEPPIVPLPPNAPDTTSHNFIGTQYEFGTSPGFLGDCSIISDSDIWCVGAINEATESTYNAVHWDGKGWELKKISVEYKGNMITPNLEGIFSFSTTDIWVSSGVPAHYDGNSWTQYHLFDMGILSSTDGAVNKIWGISPNNFFIVGDIGTIVHFDGTVWTKQSSGTTIDLRDVWGSPDGSVVWASGYSNDNSQSILLKYDGAGWKTVWTRQGTATPPYGDLVTSLWGEKHLFTSTNFGVYVQNISGVDTAKQILAINHFPYRMRGSAENNIAVAGDDGMIWHYNGANWRLLNDVGSGVPLYSVVVSDNMIVAVGADFNVTDIFPPKALIYMGRRQ